MSGVSFNFIPYVDVEIPGLGGGVVTLPQAAPGIMRSKLRERLR